MFTIAELRTVKKDRSAHLGVVMVSEHAYPNAHDANLAWATVSARYAECTSLKDTAAQQVIYTEIVDVYGCLWRMPMSHDTDCASASDDASLSGDSSCASACASSSGCASSSCDGASSFGDVNDIMDVDVLRSPLSVEDRARLISDVFDDGLDEFDDFVRFQDELLAELRLAESLAELNAPNGMDLDADDAPVQPQLPVVSAPQHADRGALRDGLGLG